MATLTLMCGFPRSGKSTWVKNNRNGRLVIEPDWIRRVILGHQFHKPAEPVIWLITDSFIRICLSQGQDVILDGTNLQPFVRMKYIELAKSLNHRIVCVWISTPMHICIQRNNESPEGKKLPTNVLTFKESEFTPPCDTEGFDQIIKIDEKGQVCYP